MAPRKAAEKPSVPKQTAKPANNANKNGGGLKSKVKNILGHGQVKDTLKDSFVGQRLRGTKKNGTTSSNEASIQESFNKATVISKVFSKAPGKASTKAKEKAENKTDNSVISVPKPRENANKTSGTSEIIKTVEEIGKNKTTVRKLSIKSIKAKALKDNKKVIPKALPKTRTKNYVQVSKLVVEEQISCDSFHSIKEEENNRAEISTTRNLNDTFSLPPTKNLQQKTRRVTRKKNTKSSEIAPQSSETPQEKDTKLKEGETKQATGQGSRDKTEILSKSTEVKVTKIPKSKLKSENSPYSSVTTKTARKRGKPNSTETHDENVCENNSSIILSKKGPKPLKSVLGENGTKRSASKTAIGKKLAKLTDGEPESDVYPNNSCSVDETFSVLHSAALKKKEAASKKVTSKAPTQKKTPGLKKITQQRKKVIPPSIDVVDSKHTIGACENDKLDSNNISDEEKGTKKFSAKTKNPPKLKKQVANSLTASIENPSTSGNSRSGEQIKKEVLNHVHENIKAAVAPKKVTKKAKKGSPTPVSNPDDKTDDVKASHNNENLVKGSKSIISKKINKEATQVSKTNEPSQPKPTVTMRNKRREAVSNALQQVQHTFSPENITDPEVEAPQDLQISLSSELNEEEILLFINHPHDSQEIDMFSPVPAHVFERGIHYYKDISPTVRKEMEQTIKTINEEDESDNLLIKSNISYHGDDGEMFEVSCDAETSVLIKAIKLPSTEVRTPSLTSVGEQDFGLSFRGANETLIFTGADYRLSIGIAKQFRKKI